MDSDQSASDILFKLQSGGSVQLNGHSLYWDQPNDILSGTNAYGVDYMWGRPSLESIERWRLMMLQGLDIGPVPSGADI